MHVLPQLRKLEQRFPRELVVIGVHSPKFPAERDIESLRKAVQRLGIEHPVLNDPQMQAWTEYAVQAWPTLIFVDPSARVIGKHEGEFRFEEFEPLVADIVAEFDSKGMLDRRPMLFQPEPLPDTPLLFPGAVLADDASGRLFIADSSHGRLVVATLGGQVQQVIGKGLGFQEGGPSEAAFDRPQGLALEGDQLYVADSWNHALRRVDLATGQVATVAGTGEQARRVKEGPGRTSPLNSPWGLALHQGIVYIAMAGSHHLWAFDPRSGEITHYAGTGREALVDGPLPRATFSQPSGLATDGRHLYVADSEDSGIRLVDLPGSGNQVRTLVGQGLFEFGDIDGAGPTVRLQHPLGVAFDPAAGLLYVADSLNNRIKRLDPRTTETRALLGDGAAALRDGTGLDASFWEPSSLSVAGGRLYIADTNNHAIRVADLKTLEVSTLELQGL